MSKVTLVPQKNYSQYTLPPEVLNLIIESKSVLIGVNNSTIKLHLPIEAKEKHRLQYFKSCYQYFLQALTPTPTFTLKFLV